MQEELLARSRRLAAKRKNEKLKLQAGLMNTLAAATIISAFVFPIIREGDFAALLTATTWFWLFCGFVLHLVALSFMDLLITEE